MATPAPKSTQTLPTDVVDVVESGNLPGVPARSIPPTQGQIGRIKARLATEYVTAGQYQFYLNYLRSQPYDFDDLTRDVGVDVYEKMQHDAQVTKLTVDFKAGMLQDTVKVQSCISDEHDPDHDAAFELAEWCDWVIERLETPLTDVLWDMASAIADGSRIAELVYEVGPDKDGALALLLKKIKTKPRSSVAYVVDSFNNLKGVLGMVPGQPFMPQTGLIITDPAFISNFLPRDKFAIYTFRPENNDPRGTSLLRAAYDPWWVKQQAKRSFVKYLDRFGVPSLIGYTPEGAEVETEIDETGTISVAGMSPEEWMGERLASFQNATVAVFPFGAKVDKIEASGNGDAFIKAFAFTNNEMAGAILGQTLSTEQSMHQTQGAGKIHQDTRDTLMKNARNSLALMIRRDVLTPLVRYNRGEDALRLLPQVLIGGAEQHVFGELATGVAALASAQYLSESQKPGIDQMLGLPERDVEADADAALAQAAVVAAATETARAASAPPTPLADQRPQTSQKTSSGEPTTTAGTNARTRDAFDRSTTRKTASSFAFFARTRAQRVVTAPSATPIAATVEIATSPSARDIDRVTRAYGEWAKEQQHTLWESTSSTT